jgi:hypothetical protein
MKIANSEPKLIVLYRLGNDYEKQVRWKLY